jgi:hypothetical protein
VFPDGEKFVKLIFGAVGRRSRLSAPAEKASLFVLVKVIKFQPPWMAAVTINLGNKKLCFSATFTFFSMFLYNLRRRRTP